MAAPPDPLAGVFAGSARVSKKTFHMAGIAVDVLGLDELPPRAADVSCLWLLHPRLSERTRMEPVGHATITAWNERLRTSAGSAAPRGLIALSFDQRNHGSRLVDSLANEAWNKGNPRHALDMFSVFQGTAADVSQLIDYLPAYLFPHNQRRLVRHTVLGVSLGAHAAWHCILRDARITGAVIVVGCADYQRIMRQRAEKSKLATWSSTSPPGATFIGSSDFPPALLDAVREWDPAALLMGDMGTTNPPRDPSAEERQSLQPRMKSLLEGKHILNLAGGADKLVPHACSLPFLTWLSRAISPGAWFDGHGLTLVDKVFPGVGHEFAPDMQTDALRFLLDEAARPVHGIASKI